MRYRAIENMLSMAAIIAGSWRLWDWPVAAIIGGTLVILINFTSTKIESQSPDA